jgi:hypothetical protein
MKFRCSVQELAHDHRRVSKSVYGRYDGQEREGRQTPPSSRGAGFGTRIGVEIYPAMAIYGNEVARNWRTSVSILVHTKRFGIPGPAQDVDTRNLEASYRARCAGGNRGQS